MKQIFRRVRALKRRQCNEHCRQDQMAAKFRKAIAALALHITTNNSGYRGRKWSGHEALRFGHVGLTFGLIPAMARRDHGGDLAPRALRGTAREAGEAQPLYKMRTLWSLRCSSRGTAPQSPPAHASRTWQQRLLPRWISRLPRSESRSLQSTSAPTFARHIREMSRRPDSGEVSGKFGDNLCEILA
jgi:hypothetical protein